MPAANGHSAKAFLSAAWRDWSVVQGKLDGTWRLASDVFVKQGGTWKQVWVRLTAPTNGTSSINDVTATISWTAGVGQDGFKLYRNGTFVKNVTGTTTTDVVPTMQADHVYTVSAYAGTSETEQIACGTVRAEVGVPVTTVTISRNWGYVNDSWDGQQIEFYSVCTTVSNANAAYQHSLSGGPAGIAIGPPLYTYINLNQDQSATSRWRAMVTHNGVQYFGAWSNVVTVTAGRPLVRTARSDDVTGWALSDVPFSFFSDYGAFGTIVDSIQWRNATARRDDGTTWSSLVTNATNRTIRLVKPAGAGGNVTLSYADRSNGWDSSTYGSYVAGNYGLTLVGSGWFSSTGSFPDRRCYVTIRFNTRYISQGAVAPTVV